MRTRRSPKAQLQLYRAIGRSLARAAAQTTAGPAPEGYEADPVEWPCPDGPYCKDPECIAAKVEMDGSRKRKIDTAHEFDVAVC
jgi:hypothetical protein